MAIVTTPQPPVGYSFGATYGQVGSPSDLPLIPNPNDPRIAQQAQQLQAAAALQAQQLNLQGQSIQDYANAAGATVTAGGAAQEAAAYTTAAGIAGSNATLEEQSAQIKAFQEDRTVTTTIGSQRAAVSAAGFQNSGSNLSLLRDSVQQGHITNALTLMEGDINAGGFLQQEAAANAESIAATTASQASTLLAQQQKTAGALAAAQSGIGAPVQKYTGSMDPGRTYTTADGAVHYGSNALKGLG